MPNKVRVSYLILSAILTSIYILCLVLSLISAIDQIKESNGALIIAINIIVCICALCITLGSIGWTISEFREFFIERKFRKKNNHLEDKK